VKIFTLPCEVLTLLHNYACILYACNCKYGTDTMLHFIITVSVFREVTNFDALWFNKSTILCWTFKVSLATHTSGKRVTLLGHQISFAEQSSINKKGYCIFYCQTYQVISSLKLHPLKFQCNDMQFSIVWFKCFHRSDRLLVCYGRFTTAITGKRTITC